MKHDGGKGIHASLFTPLAFSSPARLSSLLRPKSPRHHKPYISHFQRQWYISCNLRLLKMVTITQSIFWREVEVLVWVRCFHAMNRVLYRVHYSEGADNVEDGGGALAVTLLLSFALLFLSVSLLRLSVFFLPFFLFIYFFFWLMFLFHLRSRFLLLLWLVLFCLSLSPFSPFVLFLGYRCCSFSCFPFVSRRYLHCGYYSCYLLFSSCSLFFRLSPFLLSSFFF